MLAQKIFQKKNIVPLVTLFLLVALLDSYFEMRTFNKVNSGPDVNIVDALFNDLRIDTE